MFGSAWASPASQSGLVEKGSEYRVEPFRRLILLPLTGKLACGADQLLQVFDARLGLFTLLLFVVLDQAGVSDDMLGLFVQLCIAGGGIQLVDQIQEPLEGVAGAGGKAAIFDDLIGRTPHGDAFGAGLFTDLLQGTGADAPSGHIDDPLHGGVIVPVGDQAQIGQGRS